MMKNKYMQLAMEEAAKAARRGEVPVGAVMVDSVTGEVLNVSSNKVMEDYDPTAHAEIVAIRETCLKLSSERLPNCDHYVTLEPCPMCAQAISFARIRRLYFAAYDEKGGGVENGAHIFHAKSCHHRPEIYGGIGEKKASEMLKEFFRNKRKI
jgi:tRNA(Arg) A34 adenosine deaminase TadA